MPPNYCCPLRNVAQRARQVSSGIYAQPSSHPICCHVYLLAPPTRPNRPHAIRPSHPICYHVYLPTKYRPQPLFRAARPFHHQAFLFGCSSRLPPLFLPRSYLSLLPLFRVSIVRLVTVVCSDVAFVVTAIFMKGFHPCWARLSRLLSTVIRTNIRFVP